MKTELEMLVSRLKVVSCQRNSSTRLSYIPYQEPDASLYLPALDAIKDFIKTSTSSMTAVPKPLKFLRPHFDDLTKCYEKWADRNEKVRVASHFLVSDTYSRVADRASRCPFCAGYDPRRRGEIGNTELSPSCALCRSWLLGS